MPICCMDGNLLWGTCLARLGTTGAARRWWVLRVMNREGVSRENIALPYSDRNPQPFLLVFTLWSQGGR
jgi:hypothetical protein